MFSSLTPVQGIATFTLIIAAIMNAYLAWRTLRKPRRPEGRTLGYMFIGLAWWALLYGLHIVMRTYELQYAFNILKYVGAVFVPALTFVVAAQYTQRWEHFSPKVRFSLFIPPVLALIVIGSDPWLHGWWPSSQLVETTLRGYSFPVLKSSHSLIYYLYILLVYLYIFSGIYLLWEFQRKASSIYRRQVWIMIGAFLIPTVANIITQIGFPLPWGLDAFFFTVTAALLGWAILRYGLSELVPVARETILQQIPEGVITLDEKGTILDINPSAVNLLNASPENLIGQPLETHIAAIGPLGDAIRDVWAQPAEETSTQEVRLAGSARAYLLHSTPLQFSGCMIGRILVLQDISEQINARNQIEKLLEQTQQERQRLQITLHNASEGILLLDMDGEVVASNTGAQKLLPHQGIHQFPQPIREAWEKAQKSGNPIRIESTIAQKTLHIGVSPVPNTGTVITLQDVTSLVEGLRLNNELISILSHDLRAPLSSISGYAQLARLNNLSRQEYADIFERIDASARRLANFASDILTLSRLETGIHTEVEKAPIMVNKIAQYIAQDMEGAARAKGLLFQIKVQPHPPFYGETHLIEQMWRNLIDNAIKYTEAGFIRISVHAEENEIIAQITDTGIGIAPEDQSHIFEKFYRSKSDRDQGVGLGLSLVKNIVERHNGTISVESIPNQGTTFTMRFPLTHQ